MASFKDLFSSAWRYFVTDGVPASGPWKPSKAEITAIGAALDTAINTASAGITTVATTAARDTFYADPDNQSKLVYVNDNNGASDDPANGVYEYVDGAARLAEGFYSGVASVVQPLVDEAAASASDASDSAAQAQGAYGQILAQRYPIFPNSKYFGTISFLNKSGKVLFGLDAQGHVINEKARFYPIFPNAIAFGSQVTVNSAGKIVAGTVSYYSNYTSGVLNDGGVWLIGAAKSVKLSTPIAAAYNPVLEFDTVRWVDGASYRSMKLRGMAAVPASVTKVIFYPDMGQSHTTGTIGLPLATTSAVSQKAFAFGGWARPLQDADVGVTPTAINDLQLSPLAPLIERAIGTSFGETQGSGFAAVMDPTLGSDTIIVFATFGVGGARLNQINKGTAPYQNLTRATERLAAWCKLTGRTLSIPAMLFDQGHEEVVEAHTPASWQAGLVQFQSDVTADLGAKLTEQGFAAPAQIPLLMWQESDACQTGVSNCDIDTVVTALTRSMPTKFFVVGAHYPNPGYGPDGLHFIGLGYRWLGEYRGRAAIKFAATGDTGALRLTGVSNSGTTITATTNAATQLAIDTALVSDPGQYGLVLVKDSDGSKVGLSGIAVSGTNQITMTAASPLTVGATYYLAPAYFIDASAGSVKAGPTTGQRCCFRDSSADTLTAAAGGGAKYNWLCTDLFPFTAA